MMTKAFCTIITGDYFHYAYALYKSYSRFQKIPLYVFYTGELKGSMLELDDIHLYSIKELDQLDEYALGIKEKYYAMDISVYRWSMKSIALKYLLKKGFDQALFLDADLFFINNFDFLFDELTTHRALLIPHWRTINPKKNEFQFNALFTEGLYNAGFLGVNKDALPILDWLSEVNMYKCEFDISKGLYYDQGFLSVLPIYFDGVKVLKHQGCNLADWNTIECKRTRTKDGIVKINKKWDAVFIHFTKYTISEIRYGNDTFLLPYLEEWEKKIKEFKSDFIAPTVLNNSKERKSKRSLKLMMERLSDMLRTRFNS